jgi:hypothetical protein
MRHTPENAGFIPPSTRPLGRERRSATVAELVATVALALSTLVAATAVTVGIARAGATGAVAPHEAGVFGTALVLGFLFIVMGGIAALRPPCAGTADRPRRD